MLVSIFIPTYNASASLEMTMQSVLGQSYRQLEVWVVDDASTDDTLVLLRQWQARDERVHLILKEKNDGFVCFGWNQVLGKLKGEFVLYLSHDDRLAPDCVEQLVRRQESTGADAVIPQVFFVRGEEDETDVPSGVSLPVCLSPKTAFARMLNYDIPGFALWRLSVVRAIGMPLDAWNADEGAQRLWALHCTQGVALCPEARFFYRLTSSSITQGLKPYHLTGLRTQRRLFLAALSAGTWLWHPGYFARFMWRYVRSILYLRKVKS